MKYYYNRQRVSKLTYKRKYSRYFSEEKRYAKHLHKLQKLSYIENSYWILISKIWLNKVFKIK